MGRIRNAPVVTQQTMTEQHEPPPKWDLTTTMVMVLVIALLLFLTFELWAPH